MIRLIVRTLADGSAAGGKEAARAVCTQLGLALWPRNPLVSRSGTAGLAAVAISDACAVGVDVERIDERVVDESLLAVVLHPLEHAATNREHLARDFFGLWTRKEAVLKAVGQGLMISPQAIMVGFADHEWSRVTVPGHGEVAVRSFEVPHGFAGALAIVADTNTREYPLVSQTLWPLI
jgi:phosphopantetheinyl transferase